MLAGDDSGALRGELYPHPIVGRLDARRQFAPQGLVVEIRVQVGQDGAPGLDARDPGKRQRQMRVARMLGVAQRVDDPALDAFERGERRLVQSVDVARIGERPEAETERADAAMALPEALYRKRAPCPCDPER